VTLGTDDLAALHERTEGRPVGLYLAALYLREGGTVGTAAASFGGDDRFVSERHLGSLPRRASGAPGPGGAVGRCRRQLAAPGHTNPRLDPYTEGPAGLLRAVMCRHGAEQMRADADEAARKLAEARHDSYSTPLLQGLAKLLCGDIDGADAFFAEAEAIENPYFDAHQFAMLRCERSLVAMARNQWDQAEDGVRRAQAGLRRGGAEDSYAVAFTSAIQARIALHRGDVPAARRELINALRLRPLLTYAQPHWAVQLRIALIRVHLALSDLAGARTIMREIEEILQRRPGLGTLAGEAEALRAQLSRQRSAASSGVSALTAAEWRLLPLLATHLSFPEMAAELFLSPHTVKSQMKSLYLKLGVSTRNEAVTRARKLELIDR
jgi:LuxR family maltose regulon positive regulatory protein